MKRIWMPLFCLAMLFTVLSRAQAQMEPRKPEPELKKLAYFEGSWKLDGEIKPGPMGPGGKMTVAEKCDWQEGGFFLVCHSEYASPMGNIKSISFMGYDPNEKMYTYDDFGSNGQKTDSPGTFDGETWAFTNEEKMGGQTMKGRWTMKVTSPSSYNFKFEISTDGASWTTVMDGKATKS